MRATTEIGGREDTWIIVLGLGLLGGYLALLGIAADRASYDLWGAVIVLPVLAALSYPLLKRAARAELDDRVILLIVMGLALKMLGTLLRYLMAFDLYDGSGDSTEYAEAGVRLAELFRQGYFTVDLGKPLVGTGFIEVLTGVTFALIGATTLGGFFVFSWLSFWGMYLFYRAVRIGLPDADHRRYALLLFLLPSLVFWPSSIGKDAWMVLTLGISAYGAARLLTGRRSGYPILAVGLASTAIVRPHMSALICAGLVVGYALRRSPRRQRGPSLASVSRVIGIAVLIGASALVLQQVESYFEVEGAGVQGVEQVLDQTAAQTDQGGSNFEATNARSITQLPMAIVAVLFRPFPFEARNMQALIASLEGSVLMVLFLTSAGRLKSLPGYAIRNPYITFAVIYTLLFALAFSSFGNFGILVRQRVQLFPLVLVLLALPAPVKALKPWRAHN